MAGSDVSEAPTNAMLVVRRLIGGTVGGILQALTSHPFDTVKSRVQRGEFRGLREGALATIQQEGVGGFYRGLTPPLLLNGVYNALMFGIHQRMLNAVAPEGYIHGRDKMPLWRTALAGQLTGPIYCIAMVPMENIKVKLQTQPKTAGKQLYAGPLDCIRKTYQSHGLPAIFSGYTVMVWSRIVGLPFFFGGYEYTRNLLVYHYGYPTDHVIVPITGGVSAGIGFWVTSYPFDYVKTQVQASVGVVRGLAVAQQTYKAGGVTAFYRGFGAAIVRAVPAAPAAWIGIEYTTKFMESQGW